MREARVCTFSIIVSLLIVASLSAQTSTAAQGSLKDLFLHLVERGAAGVPGGSSPESLEAITTFGELATLEVSTAPRGTSTGGLTYVYDQSLGTWSRTTTSLGPMFAERSLTTGKGKLGAGFNWIHANYNSYGSQDIRNGGFRPAINGRNTLGAVSYTTLKMNLVSNTVEGFAIVGVTNDLDVGIAVPWVKVSLDADYGLFNATNEDLTNVLVGGRLTIPSVSASGMGDISIFGKYHVWHHHEGGLAGEILVQLPSGDADNLRGVGVTRTLLGVIWSQGGRISPHANLGYEIWSAGVPVAPLRNVFAKNQVKYAFGFEFEAYPRATAILDIVGRRQLNAGQLEYVTVPGPGRQGTLDVLVGAAQGLNVVSLAPGAKWNAWGNVLVTGSVLATWRNSGLRANVVPVLGVDWTF